MAGRREGFGDLEPIVDHVDVAVGPEHAVRQDDGQRARARDALVGAGGRTRVGLDDARPEAVAGGETEETQRRGEGEDER